MGKRRRRVPQRRPVSVRDLHVRDAITLIVGVSEDEIADDPDILMRLREQWVAVREDLLPHPNKLDDDDDFRTAPGERPWAWWRFEAREEQPPTLGEQRDRLQALGELLPWEAAAAERHLRRLAVEKARNMQRRRESVRVDGIADELGVLASQVAEWLSGTTTVGG